MIRVKSISRFLLIQLIISSIFFVFLIFSFNSSTYFNKFQINHIDSLSLGCSSLKYDNITIISDGYDEDWGWNDADSVDPAIAIDNSGNIHVVWTDYTNGTWGSDPEIMYVNYTAESGWSNATVVSDGYDGEWGWNDADSVDPAIAIDNSGNIHVVWMDNTDGIWGSDPEIMYVNYTAESGWSNATVVSDGYDGEWGWNDGISWFPAITADNSGNIHVVWTDWTEGKWGSDFEIMYVNYTAESGWSNATVVSDGYNGEWGWNDGASGYPAIAADNSGNIHVVWMDNTDGIWGSDSEIMYIKINKLNGPRSSSLDLLWITIIVLSTTTISGLSVFTLKKVIENHKRKRLNTPHHKKQPIFHSKKPSENDKNDLLLLFDKEEIPKHLSYLKLKELTYLSDDFLEKLKKIKLQDFEKQQFLEEILSFSQETRNKIIDDILEKQNNI